MCPKAPFPSCDLHSPTKPHLLNFLPSPKIARLTWDQSERHFTFKPQIYRWSAWLNLHTNCTTLARATIPQLCCLGFPRGRLQAADTSPLPLPLPLQTSLSFFFVFLFFCPFLFLFVCFVCLLALFLSSGIVLMWRMPGWVHQSWMEPHSSVSELFRFQFVTLQKPGHSRFFPEDSDSQGSGG